MQAEPEHLAFNAVAMNPTPGEGPPLFSQSGSSDDGVAIHRVGDGGAILHSTWHRSTACDAARMRPIIFGWN
jgi:hypothetical protein